MKKQKIKVDGVRYKYIITQDNTIRFDGIVPYTTSEEIKRRLIKKGIWKPEVNDPKEINTEERFAKWCNTELKILVQDHTELSKAAEKELERRGVKYE